MDQPSALSIGNAWSQLAGGSLAVPLQHRGVSTYPAIRPLYDPRKHRRCECCGAEWKWQLAYEKLSKGRAKKMPFEWVKFR